VFTKNQPLDPISIQMNPVYTLAPYFSRMNFNIHLRQSSKQVLFQMLLSCQRICSSLRTFVTFHYMLAFLQRELIRPTSKLKYHALLAVHVCLFNIFTPTLYSFKPSPRYVIQRTIFVRFLLQCPSDEKHKLFQFYFFVSLKLHSTAQP
jgi:hypothetical protein